MNTWHIDARSNNPRKRGHPYRGVGFVSIAQMDSNGCVVGEEKAQSVLRFSATLDVVSQVRPDGFRNIGGGAIVHIDRLVFHPVGVFRLMQQTFGTYNPFG